MSDDKMMLTLKIISKLFIQHNTERHNITEILLKVVLNTITTTKLLTKTLSQLTLSWSYFEGKMQHLEKNQTHNVSGDRY
jgi:hypothetical protein